MKAKHVLLAAFLLIIGIVACRKETPLPLQPAATNQSVSGHVVQKPFNKNTAELIQLIGNFKNNNLRSPDDSLALDSAITLVEATLNYDYDRHRDDNYELIEQEVTYSIPLNESSMKVGSADAANVLQQFNTWLGTLLSNDIELVVIDLEGAVPIAGNGEAVITGTALLMAKQYVNPCTPPSNFGQTAISGPMWSVTNPPCFFNNSSCLGMLNGMLNCSPQTRCPDGGRYYFWSPVGQHNNAGTPNTPSTNFLYSSGYQNGSFYCAGQPLINSTALINNYVGPINAYTTANVIPPAGQQIIGKQVGEWMLTSSGNLKSCHWRYRVTYGQRNCYEPNQ